MSTNIAFDMIDPLIVVKPNKWLTPYGMLNPNNPLTQHKTETVQVSSEPQYTKINSDIEMYLLSGILVGFFIFAIIMYKIINR